MINASVDSCFHDATFTRMNVVFITYNSTPAADDKAYNDSLLHSGKSTAYSLSVFNANSQEYLNEQYIKLTPLILCVFFIILAGLTCSVSMNTYGQMRNYGIFFLCGCRWKGCLKISAAYAAIIMTGGTILGAVGFLLFSFSDYAKLFEQNIQINNLYVSIGVVAVMFLLSLIIPFFMVRRTSPVETIREN